MGTRTRRRGGMLPQLNDDVNKMIGDYVSHMEPTHADYVENLSKYSKVNRYGNAVFSSALFEGKESAEDLAAYLAANYEPWKGFMLLCRHPRLSDDFLLKVAMKIWKMGPIASHFEGLHQIPIMKRQKTMAFLMKRRLLTERTLCDFVENALAAGDTDSLDFFVSLGLPGNLRVRLGTLDGLPDNSLTWLCAHANLPFAKDHVALSAPTIKSAKMVRKLAKSGCDIFDLSRSVPWPNIKKWVEVDPTLAKREPASARAARIANVFPFHEDELISDLEELTFWADHDVVFNQDAQNNALRYLARVYFPALPPRNVHLHIDMAQLLIRLLRENGVSVPEQIVQKVTDAGLSDDSDSGESAATGTLWSSADFGDG
jgi:hypothetical protein